MWKFLFKPQAGGVLYHLKARRYAHSLWRSYRLELETLLLGYLPKPHSTGILIGPSSGYCLTQATLDRFQTLIAIDPDASAKRSFLKTFPNTNCHWHLQDAFSFSSRGDFEFLTDLDQRYPDNVFLFCNVLGQIPYLHNSPFTQHSVQFQNWQQHLRTFLENKNWISFHDRLSGPTIKKKWSEHTESPLSNEQVLNSLGWPPQAAIDHWTQDLFPDGPHAYILWHLSRARTHVIEVTGSVR